MRRPAIRALALALVATLIVPASVESRQFRAIQAIPTPQTLTRDLPPGAVVSETIEPIPHETVERRMGQLIAKWNTPEMEETLAQEFYDRTRLLDTVETQVPKDAKLRLLGVQSAQTLQQYHLPGPNGRFATQVSIVAAVARTQIEYSGAGGLVRLPGTNEFLLKVEKTLK
tara:strand:- start:426 stop:938 length:513 start_codon:yes stop_codon:yes gene_type:complete